MVPSGHDRHVRLFGIQVRAENIMIEIYLILLFMIFAALIAVQAKDLLSSVIGIGAVGIGLSLAFLVLKAPDLAIMQLVVEILSLIILVRGTIHKDLPFSASGRWLFNTLSTLIFVAVFLVFAYMALRYLPGFGNSAMKTSRVYIEEGSAMAGERNIISVIALNYRAFDTLGEVTVLFLAVIGVIAMTRTVRRSGKEGR